MAYTFSLRPVLAAAVAAAVLMPGAALAAQPNEIVVVLGAIKDPANAQSTQAPVDRSVRELPIVYEAKKTDDAPAGDRAAASKS